MTAPRFGLSSLLSLLGRDRRGSSDLTTYLLLTAAGCTMIGLTAPHLFNSSRKASNTFEHQVDVLERGSSPNGSGPIGAGDWSISVGPNGVQGTAGGLSATVDPTGSISASGTSGSVTVSGSGGSQANAGTGAQPKGAATPAVQLVDAVTQ